MTINIDEVFNTVRASLDNQNNQRDALWKEKLKFEANKEYVVRLVPYVKEGVDGYKKSLYHYIRYSWQDNNGKWVQVISPRSWNGDCPIAEYSTRVKFRGLPEEKKELDKRLSYREGAYANVYVISDPTNPENNGKVKILDMGKKLYDIIKGALDGDLDKTWTEQARTYSNDPTIEINVGKKVYDLKPSGLNLIIRVHKNQFKLNSYDTSGFSLSGTDLHKTDEEIEQIYQSCFDLAQIDKIYSYDELRNLFTKTFFNHEDTSGTSAKPEVEIQQPSPVNSDNKGDVSNSVLPTSENIEKDKTEQMIDDAWFAQFGMKPN